MRRQRSASQAARCHFAGEIVQEREAMASSCVHVSILGAQVDLLHCTRTDLGHPDLDLPALGSGTSAAAARTPTSLPTIVFVP